MSKKSGTTILVFLVLFALTPQICAQGGGKNRSQRRQGEVPDTLPTTLTAPRISNDTRPVKFTSRTEMVLVPVVVLHKNGEHVTGLKKDAFKIFENGAERPIVGADEFSSQTADYRPAPTAAGEFTNELSATTAPHSINIIALDTINTPFLDQTRAREELIKALPDLVDASQPTELLLVSERGIRTIHPLTADAKVLVAELEKLRGQISLSNRVAEPDYSNPQGMLSPLVQYMHTGTVAAPSQFVQSAALDSTLEALQSIARSVAGIPGRKSLVWAGAGFPFNVDIATGALIGDAPISTFQHTIDALNDANVAVYPVDVRGLVNTSADAAAWLQKTEGTSAKEAVAFYSSYHADLNADRIGTIRFLADATGGRAFINRNDFGAEYTAALHEGSDYYMLTYYLDKSNARAGWRKLKVEVNVPDATVRARHGFYVSRTTMDPNQTRVHDLFWAARAPFDYTAIPLRVRVTPAGKRLNVELTLPPLAVTMDETDGNRVVVDFMAVSFADSGKQGPGFSQTLDMRPQSEALEQIRQNGITYTNSLELPKGSYTVKFIVRDNLTGNVGSVAAPVTMN